MFKRLLLGCIVIAGVISVTAGNGFGQSVFRVGAWCFRPTTAPPDPIYQLPSGEWRVKGAERDKLLNLGLNYFIACTGLNGEDALVFMGDSLDAAPAPKNFK
ncbi:MAG: hypothetical protein ONB44_21070, partial [candidate division KSB1 bacterium]|nr:hypothetical protein [candidate division KSB1 bacterium]